MFADTCDALQVKYAIKLRWQEDRKLRPILYVLLVLAISGCARLDDGQPRASFFTAILDEMQRSGFTGTIRLVPSDSDRWPFSFEKAQQQLRQDGFEPLSGETNVPIQRYLAGDCISSSSEREQSVIFRMNNNADPSRLTYQVGLHVDDACKFNGATISIVPEDGVLG